jgi:hypothetical protein
MAQTPSSRTRSPDRSSRAGQPTIAALPTSPRSGPAAPIIPTRRSSPAIVRDPKDDHLAALARAADADLLVSIDNDLLEAPVDDVTTCRPEILLNRLAGGFGHDSLARGLNPRKTAGNHRHQAHVLVPEAPANQHLPPAHRCCLKIVVSPVRVRVSPS